MDYPDETEDVVVTIPAEKEDLDDAFSNDDLFNITSWGADLSFRELVSMYDDNDLLKPELQRKYVWDITEASRFIDSILLGLPVPSIFLANTKDGKKLIIDGYQRIMTVYDYIKGIFSKDRRVFKLLDSDKINSRWKGKAFIELTDTEQRKIRTTTIHSIIFEQKHPNDNDTSLYQIFERINTSGKTLKPQEIRNCIYQGAFNSLLFELNRIPSWRLMFATIEDHRMLDIEFILRFFALSDESVRNRKNGQLSLKQFLSRYMGSDESKNLTVLQERKISFSTTIEALYQLLGETAFYNISPKDPDKYINKFHPTVFDSISIATKYVLSKGVDPMSFTDLKKRKKSLLMDDKFRYYSAIRTTNYEAINGRISLAVQYLFDSKYE